MLSYLLISLLPLLAFLVLALGGRRLDDTAHRVGISAIGLSFLLSLAAFASVAQQGTFSIPLYRLLASGGLTIDFDLFVDELAALLLVLVTGVSFIVHVYSSKYMIGDPRYRRFFAIIALFTFAMVTLVMSNNLLLTFMCWEIMGACSYLLISHSSERKAACRAATKAFLVNAVADVGLGFGVILTLFFYGTLDIQQILAQAPAMNGQGVNILGWIGAEWWVDKNTLITLCFFTGALGKSAQVPFHVWLPFAMEAPTPVSALIHAATMVNAGPFLLARLSPLVILSPGAMAVIAAVGATTALFGALVSLTQPDIKKLLAYSTISQIGFMIFLCGVGAFTAAVFHLLAHGFFKAYLFLSTGSALESLTAHGHSGSAHETPAGIDGPVAFAALLLGLIPAFLLFSGPYEQMWMAHGFSSAQAAFWVIGLITVFFTAMYVFRGAVSLFGQGAAILRAGTALAVQPRLFSPRHAPGLIAAGAALVVFLAALWSWFAPFLAPALAQRTPIPEPAGLLGAFSPWHILPFLAAAGGWGCAYFLHRSPRAAPLGAREWAKSAYVLFLNKLYFDEIYDVYVVRPTLGLCRWLWHEVEVRVIDRLIQRIAVSALRVSHGLWRVVEFQGVERAVQAIATGSLTLSTWLWSAMEIRQVDRMVQGVATSSVKMSHWLWQVLDVRGTERAVEQLGRLADGGGQALQRIEPRTLRHHLIVVVCWLVLAIGLWYWLGS